MNNWRNIVSRLFFFMILLACFACGSKPEPAGSREEAKELRPLPDTVCASASELTYEVEVLDTLGDAVLQDLGNAYDSVPGWFTFRASAMRDVPREGRVKGTPTRIVNDWTFQTEMKGTWGGGSGWNGQPVYVEWTEKQMAEFQAQSPGLTADFGAREIMVGSLAGKVYFINFDNGRASRTPIDVTHPVKGSVSLDPALNGSLYVGQGIPGAEPFGHLAIDLFKHERAYVFGTDRKAYRSWGAYDSSPVAAGQFLFWPGENGSVYKYTRQGHGQLRLHSVLRYRTKRGGELGTENSMCIYRNYGYIGDNSGHVICINLNTMRPVWHYDNVDDIDASIVCEVDSATDTPYIYCGCEVDKQGASGISHLVKLNGLTGERVWERELPCLRLSIGQKHFDGGFYCTPLLGRGDCSDLMFASICQPGTSHAAELTAFRRATGETVWTLPLHFFAWSSPVPFYNERGELFVLAGDSSGYLYLVRGKTGKLLFKGLLGDNFESSPIVTGNYAVVGSRGNRIMRFRIE